MRIIVRPKMTENNVDFVLKIFMKWQAVWGSCLLFPYFCLTNLYLLCFKLNACSDVTIGGKNNLRSLRGEKKFLKSWLILLWVCLGSSFLLQLMDTPVPGPHQDSSQFQTATVWGKLFWPSLHPHLRAPRWSTAASQTSESSPHRVGRASCRWWATSSWTCDLTRSHKNPYYIYFHSNCLVQIAVSNCQNLIEDKHCRLFVIIFWCLATMLFNISVFTLNKFEVLNRSAQPHWHIGEIFAESFFNKSTQVSFDD